MRFEGQTILRPSTYHPERFKKKDKLLIEIIIRIKKGHLMKLYFIAGIETLSVTKNNNLKFKDVKSGMTYNEDTGKVIINVYDSYSVEVLRTEYEDLPKEIYSMDICLIYANGRVLPAIRHNRKATCPNPLGYTYSLITKG